MLTLSSELQLWPASFQRMYNSTSIILYVSGSQPTACGLHATRHESECGSPWIRKQPITNPKAAHHESESGPSRIRKRPITNPKAAHHVSERGSPCWMLQSYVLNIIKNNFQFYN